MLRYLAIFAHAALASSLVPHEVREVTMSNARHRIDPSALLPMRIALTPNTGAMRLAESWLHDVSNPQSATYGRYWSQQSVIDTFKPTDETINNVVDWLSTNGIERVTHTDNKQWIAFDLAVWKAEKLFNTTYYKHHTKQGHFEIACDEYYVPLDLRIHIDFITPGVKSIAVSGRAARNRDHAHGAWLKARQNALSHTKMPPGCHNMRNCSFCLTPACIRALYNFTTPNLEMLISSNNTLGIYQSQSIWYQGDLDDFYSNFTQIPVGTSPILRSIDGGIGPPLTPPISKKNVSLAWEEVEIGEGDLDVQVAQPIIYPQNLTVFSVNDPYWDFTARTHGEHTGLFNTFLDAIDGSYCEYCAYGECGDAPFDPKYPDNHTTVLGSNVTDYPGKLQCGVYKPTNVISISYGAPDLYWPFNYQRRQCNEYLKLALQGVSIFVASGDSGVGDCSKKKGRFQSQGPGDCPWLVSVGGTQISPGNSPYDPEEAATLSHAGFYSSGGFSIVFDAPDYQKKAIQTYYNVSNPPYKYFENGNYRNSTGRYNRNGRGFPDVSACGSLTATWTAGSFYLGGGTSAATPLVASLFNRIIEERLRAGKGLLGLLNPSMYQNPHLFHDIVKGDNPGCGTQGFQTAIGWDPVTGLGTPNYPKLLEYYMSLP